MESLNNVSPNNPLLSSIMNYFPYDSTKIIDFSSESIGNAVVTHIKYPENFSVKIESSKENNGSIISLNIEKTDVESPDSLLHSFAISMESNNVELDFTTYNNNKSYQSSYSIKCPGRFISAPVFNMEKANYEDDTKTGRQTLSIYVTLYGAKRAPSNRCSYGMKVYDSDNEHPKKYALRTNFKDMGKRLAFISKKSAKKLFYDNINRPDTAHHLYDALIGLGFSNENIMPFLYFLNDNLFNPELMKQLWHHHQLSGYDSLLTQIQSIASSHYIKQSMHFFPIGCA